MMKIDLKPKPKYSFEELKPKLITALLVFLALFAVYKTHVYSTMANELLYMRTENAIIHLKDADKTTLDTAFIGSDYCGWQVVRSGETITSENYAKRNPDTPIFNYENESGKFSVCMRRVVINNDSAQRNIIGILLVAGMLYFLTKKEAPAKKHDNQN